MGDISLPPDFVDSPRRGSCSALVLDETPTLGTTSQQQRSLWAGWLEDGLQGAGLLPWEDEAVEMR